MILLTYIYLYGRRYIYIISISFFLLWNIPCAVGQNIQTILVGRFLGGLAGSAFLSVAAGTVSDLFMPAKVGPPMMLFPLSPFIGPPLGPLVVTTLGSLAKARGRMYGSTMISLLKLKREV